MECSWRRSSAYAGATTGSARDQTREFLRDVTARWDGERVLVIAHSAWSLEHLLQDRPLEELVDAPFDWRPGWTYRLPSG